MAKISVFAPFTLCIAGEEERFFPAGEHEVSEAIAAHPYVRQNANIQEPPAPAEAPAKKKAK